VQTEARSCRRGAVLVTGASTGIGEACALRLAHSGYLVFAGVRKQSDGEALRVKAAGSIEPVSLDVTDEASVAAATALLMRRLGGEGLRGVVNNAGVAVASPVEFVPVEDLRRQFEVNVIGQIAVVQAVFPLLRRASGRVVNIGSIAGRLTWPYLGPYSASKHALASLTDALRRELGRSGVRVSLVEPGSVATPIWVKSKGEALKTASRLPSAAHEQYGTAMSAVVMRSEDAERIGMPAARVARLVEHVLNARRPRPRYLLGWDARLLAAIQRWLPVGWVDGILTGVLSRRAGRRPR
jgi:NAD(P)-dependent dehydrogenase (short-subunit alcohol dehydrogenase family)